MKDTKSLDGHGYVYSHTTVNRDRSGNKSSWPTTIALVKFEDAKGGIVHRLEADSPETVSIGMKVVPILKPPTERSGALTDIIAFKAE